MKSKILVGLVFGIVLCSMSLSANASLVSYWNADNNAYDSAGNNNGSIQGGVTYSTGINGEAFSFNGIDGSVLIPHSDSLDLKNSWTLSAWIYTTNMSGHLGGGQGILSMVGGPGGNNGIQFTIVDNYNSYEWPSKKAWIAFNAPDETWPSNTLTSTPEILMNQWTHIAATYDNDYEYLYINGVLAGSLHIGPKQMVTTSSNMRISLDDNGNVPFSGLIDEVRIYDSALSSNEISMLHASITPVPVPATILLFSSGIAGLVGIRMRKKGKNSK